MDAGLIVLLASSGAVVLAVAIVIALVVLRGGLGMWAPKHAPGSELDRARQDIEAQIGSGRGGWDRI